MHRITALFFVGAATCAMAAPMPRTPVSGNDVGTVSAVDAAPGIVIDNPVDIALSIVIDGCLADKDTLSAASFAETAPGIVVKTVPVVIPIPVDTLPAVNTESIDTLPTVISDPIINTASTDKVTLPSRQ